MLGSCFVVTFTPLSSSMATLVTVLGVLRPLALVTWFLGTALAQNELCERIRADPKNINLQALSPLGIQLHLIAWDILYTVSFTGETIDSVRGKMNFNCKGSGSKWTQVPWLKPAVEKIGQQEPILVYMNIFVDPEGNQENPSQKHAINVIYRMDSPSLEQVWLNPGGRNITRKPTLYGAVTTGALGRQALRYLFHGTKTPGLIVMGLTSRTVKFPILASDKRTVVFHKEPPTKSHRTLVTRLPVFGFIHSNVVHLWDTENGHVVLFDNVPELDKHNSDGSDKNVSVRFVPFQDYFVCADESQNCGPVNLQSNSNSGNWFWIPAVFLLGSLIISALGFWYYKFRQGKKTKKGSKVISSSLSISSKAKPTQTTGTTPTSSTTFSKLFATSKNSSSTIQKSVSIGSSLKTSCTTKTPTKTPTNASGPSKTPKTAIGYKKIDGPHFDPKGKKVTVAIPSDPIRSSSSQSSQVEFGPTSVYFKH